MFKDRRDRDYEGFSVTPLFRYVDSRYAECSGYHAHRRLRRVRPLSRLHQTEPLQFKEATFSLTFQNLFDTRYISTINNSQDDSLSTDSTTYKVGAPFTVVAGVKFSF